MSLSSLRETEIELKRVEEQLKNIVPVLSFVRRRDARAHLLKLRIDLRSEERFCVFCGSRVTEENIGALIETEDDVKLVCNKRECLAEVDILRPLFTSSKS